LPEEPGRTDEDSAGPAVKATQKPLLTSPYGVAFVDITRRRTVRMRVVAGIFGVLAALSTAGCSDDGPSKDEVVDALVEDGLDESAAVCAVNGFYGDVSKAGLEAIVRGSEALDDPDDEAAFTASFQSCTGVGFTADTPAAEG
jgi:hypothetical protein